MTVGTLEARFDARRRRWLKAAALGAPVIAGAWLTPRTALAQEWPGRQPIRFVVPYPPGGASDVTARALSTKLNEALGANFVVENRPGANGIIALESVAKAPPDGYTLLMANLGPNAINPGIYSKLPFDPIKDFTPITLTSVVPLVVLVTPSLPVKTFPELIAYAKAHPGQLTFASAGIGAANHLAGEMIKSAAGIDIRHVPYKGDAPSFPDLISGTVSMAFPTVIGGMPQIKAGGVRAIATTGAKRSPALPDLPTVAENGIASFEAVSWGGVMGPAGLPPAIVARLNTEIVKILKMPDIAEKLSTQGAQIVGSSPEEFARYLDAEIRKWGAVARASRIQLE